MGHLCACLCAMLWLSVELETARQAGCGRDGTALGNNFLRPGNQDSADTHTPLSERALTAPLPNRCPVFLHPGLIPA